MTEQKYEPSAGQCDKCGHYKTWGFKVVNPKTGKQVPGHITEAGYRLGNGDCPYYAKKSADPADPPAKFETAEQMFASRSTSNDQLLELIASRLEELAVEIRRRMI